MTLAYQEYYTLDDYQHWRGDWELTEGMPYAMSPLPTVTHQTVALNSASELKTALNKELKHCAQCSVLMETDWHIANDTVVRPDVMLVCQTIHEKVRVTPELIIEVVSLSSTKRDELMKFDLYQREGVLYYILVYPDIQLAKVYQNKAEGFRKIGDYASENISFAIRECQFLINFEMLWR